MTIRKLASLCAVPLLLTGCPREKALTLAEASQALEEASAASEAEGFTSASIDISTNFTIGEAARDAAAEVRDFIGGQLPCAALVLEGATLTVDYGVNSGTCLYRGHQFSGRHAITVERIDANEAVVRHAWTDLSNGRVSLDGTATVTWDFEAQTRHVVHETEFTNLRSGRVGRGSGDRTQSVLAGGLAEGIRVDGVRSWESERGRWDLAIDGVELGWTDPVPRAGSYTLSTPFDKTLTLSFARVDVDTIRVQVEGPEQEFSFTVSKAGAITQDD